MNVCVSYVVLDIQVPTEEDLFSNETFTFPSVSNTSNIIVFNGTLPMIEIPTAEILNQIRNEGHIVSYECFKCPNVYYRKENCHSE